MSLRSSRCCSGASPYGAAVEVEATSAASAKPHLMEVPRRSDDIIRACATAAVRVAELRASQYQQGVPVPWTPGPPFPVYRLMHLPSVTWRERFYIRTYWVQLPSEPPSFTRVTDTSIARIVKTFKSVLLPAHFAPTPSHTLQNTKRRAGLAMSEAAWFDRFALGGIIALAMLLIAAVVYAVSSRKRGNTVVIVGPSDSGKTLLFELLVSGKHVSTHTSMVANEHTGVLFIEKTVSPSPGPVNLVDFPGQKRVRGQLQARPAE